MRGPTRNRQKLGEILVEAGVIDEMQLASALGEQTRWGRRLGVTLVKLGMVEEGHLIRALASQLDLPVASLAGKRIAEDVIALVPARVASEQGVMPLFVKREGSKSQLFVGMEDPSNLAVLDDLGFLTGMEIHPVMIGPTELGDAIDRYYLTGAGAAAKSPRRVERDPGRTQSCAASPRQAPAPAGRSPRPLPGRRRSIWMRRLRHCRRDSLDDVANALEDSQKTRVVARAIVQLLIEKGIVTLEEVQVQVARQRGSRTA